MFKAMILEKELKDLKCDYRKARISLAELRDENENCYLKIYKQDKLINEIDELLRQNNYNNAEVKLRKIIELISDYQSQN